MTIVRPFSCQHLTGRDTDRIAVALVRDQHALIVIEYTRRHLVQAIDLEQHVAKFS